MIVVFTKWVGFFQQIINHPTLNHTLLVLTEGAEVERVSSPSEPVRVND